MKRSLLLAILANCAAPAAHAAVLKEVAFVCRAEADAKMALGLSAPKNKPNALAEFRAAKIASRDCLSLIQGLVISVDEKRPPLLCVRRTGDIDCYWVGADVVDQNPPPQDKPGWPRVGKRSMKF